MRAGVFEFRLPDRLVPSTLAPEKARDQARMVVLNRGESRIEHRHFYNLGDYLRPGDVMVVNDSLVMQDELNGASRGGPMSVTLCGLHRDGWLVLAKPASQAKRGVVVCVGEGDIRVTLRKQCPETGMWLARLEHEGSLLELLERYGTRHTRTLRATRKRRHLYQNVYANKPGSVEVPSAGLHFTNEMLAELKTKRQVTVVPVTLHVGLTEMSTYRKIESDEVEDHRVAEEWYEISESAARAINGARRQGGRVVAVGTTVVRALETAASSIRSKAKLKAGQGWTDLYIHPGFTFRIVDMFLTNLHQPRSSHLVMVAAFAGSDFTMRAYREIVRDRYRFDVFGDSMLVV
jgi:S-adenosylmethionine:tRNA ribosyltransferase-isomerase